MHQYLNKSFIWINGVFFFLESITSRCSAVCLRWKRVNVNSDIYCYQTIYRYPILLYSGLPNERTVRYCGLFQEELLPTEDQGGKKGSKLLLRLGLKCADFFFFFRQV